VKYCCFRFDADTHACVSSGIPRLAELGDKLGVKFTFFVNMGRAFDPRITLAKAFGRLTNRKKGPRGAISAAGKLGWRESLKAAVLNPRAGRSDPAVLQAAARSGHEIGLHGGRNHATWERSAHTWSEARLRQEIQTGQRWMAECGIEGVDSFASPAWNSPAALRRALPALGFRVLADVYDAAQGDVAEDGGLLSMPTNIVAPGGGSAGYLETARLRGWSAQQITRDFTSQLAAKDRLAVVYDHPFFAGLHALEPLGELVRAALGEGFSVCAVSAAARSLHEGKKPASIRG
jgi:peptidoglycan/xylan/chitin deacetylase (PgdA/CDA1 family)